MDNFVELAQQLPSSLLIPTIFITSLVLLLCCQWLILKIVKHNKVLMNYHFSQHLVGALTYPLVLLSIIGAIKTSECLLNYLAVDTKAYSGNITIASQMLLILALLLFVDGFVRRTLAYYSSSSILKNSHGLIKGSLRLFIVLIGVLMIFSTLGISITPIMASLGIGSLAVALALQPTLENFFSGLQLIADKPIRVGDFIELDSGEQGFVERIGWRSTWIKMLPNNIVIMPNSMLSQSKIINYYYPEKELSVPVEVSVHYDSDLEHVERVTIEVAKEILATHKWGVASYETFVLFHTFDSSSINLTVMLRAQEYFNRFFIKSAFIKALHKRYKEEGIVIPYPIRAINTLQESVKQSITVDPEK